MDAGLNGRQLSARCGWHPAKTTRIQNGEAQPSAADIRAWCAACDAPDQAADLIATARAVDSMYLEWRRVHSAGITRSQEEFRQLHERMTILRAYCSNVIPGFLQTADYAAALLSSITRFQGTPDDVTDAVAARLARSRYLYEGRRRYVVLLEEWVLRSRIGDAATTAGQLRHLLAVQRLPSLALGIIPATATRTVWPLEAFYLYDDERALVETLTAEVNVTQPREVADYLRAHRQLAEMALYGDSARELIEAALTSCG
jgi:hypothetical protein